MMRFSNSLLSFALAIALTFTLTVPLTMSTAFAESDSSFVLGEISITARKPEAGEVYQPSASTVTRREIQELDKKDVGEALNLLPGVVLSTNARNEKLISVRGYDSRQVPLFIDGIPVYVPYDGYVDFGRFTTADLARIQVSKGFSSTAYGANTLGGAINLISRRPQKELEADASFGIASGNERRASANIGTLHENWYFQSGLSLIQTDSFPMSEKFEATASEDGGARDNSYRKDFKISAKAALTPNKTDEYAISYYSQNGEKGQPPSTNPAGARYWRWPYWNKESLYFVSQTALGDSETMKVRIYRDRFDNEVNSYTDGTYTTPKTAGTGSIGTGASIYHDVTNGGSLTLESFRSDWQQVNLSLHFKQDNHRELDRTGTETTQFEDHLFNLGLEDSILFSDSLTLSIGGSYSLLSPKKVFSVGNNYALPGEQNATDLQAGLFYKQDADTTWSFTLASKTRMPTLRDRYSQRLGTFIQNPDLQAERAFNIDLGYQQAWGHSSKLTASLFSNTLNNKIQTVANVQGALSQMQNAGRAQIYGAEFGVESRVAADLDVTGQYTYLLAENLSDPNMKLTDLPRHKVSANAAYTLAPHLKLIPSLEYNSSRWVSNTVELAGFTIFNAKFSYQVTSQVQLEAGVSNIGDWNYSLADGFPSPGRMYFANLNLEI